MAQGDMIAAEAVDNNLMARLLKLERDVQQLKSDLADLAATADTTAYIEMPTASYSATYSTDRAMSAAPDTTELRNVLGTLLNDLGLS